MENRELDAELAPWRLAREVQAKQKYARADASARLNKTKYKGQKGGCLRCHGPAHGALCKVCGTAEYWRRRLRVKPFAERADACGVEKFAGYCRKCGVQEIWDRTCGARHVCRRCSARFFRAQERRMADGLRARWQDAQDHWILDGQPRKGYPIITMMTLGLSHSGDIERDRRLLSVAWNRFRTWYARETKDRKWGKLPYAWVPECTDGTKKQGNPHFHVAIVIPYRDYNTLREGWVRATKGLATRIYMSPPTTNPQKAAMYVAKYASKGAKELSTPSLAAAWVRASHARRSISASQKFFEPAGPCAHQRLALARTRELWPTGERCLTSKSSTAGKVASESCGTCPSSESRAPPETG